MSWAGGSTRAWRRFRQDWLDEHPLCMDADLNPDTCEQLAVVVCHKPGIDYRVDRLNPEAIEGQRCRPCDARKTSQQGRAARG